MPPGGGVYEGERNEKDKREEADFNRNVGKVVDTLRESYQHIFDEPLDFDIYTPDLQLRDPVSFPSVAVVVAFAVAIAVAFVFCSFSALSATRVC